MQTETFQHTAQEYAKRKAAQKTPTQNVGKNGLKVGKDVFFFEDSTAPQAQAPQVPAQAKAPMPLPPLTVQRKTSVPTNMGYPDFEGVCPKALQPASYAQFQVDFMARKIPAAVVIGSAGGCKSFHFREDDGDYNGQCIYIAGKMKAFAAFLLLRDAIDKAEEEECQHPPLVIDDVHAAFRDPERIEFLQQVLSPRSADIARRITYTSRAAGDRSTIYYKGPCLILGNELPKKIREDQFSLFDRIAQYSYFPSMHEIHAFLKGKWTRDKEVYDFVGSNLDLVRKPSARWYDKITNEKSTNADWKQQAIEWLIGFTAEEATTRKSQNDTEKLRIMAHLMHHRNGRTDKELFGEFETLCKRHGLTGGSVADFKRVKERLYTK